MNILIIGSGGREHALAWKCAQSPLATHVYVAPGNAGTALESGVSNVELNTEDTDALIGFVRQESVALTIVGPEVPLVAGICDRFQQEGLRIFGPSQAAAQLEGSKAFTKDFMARHNIPTAAYRTFEKEQEALDYLDSQSLPIVIKADGLAAGKGVVVASTREEATAAITDMLSGNRFGKAGHRVVIEEFLSGEEASFICLVQGRQAVPLASSQDHKARDNGDEGPNTGGMGAYSPAPVVDTAVHEHIMKDVIYPTIEAMDEEGAPFCGFLYAGLMIDQGKARVVEFNVRLGDPETQPLLMRLESDLVDTCIKVLDGNLDEIDLQWRNGSSVGVVMASRGYPGSYPKGDTITGLSDCESIDSKVFHAGTTLTENNEIVSSGGRVLCVVGLADNVKEAQRVAYRTCSKINWPNAYYRSDIGYRAVRRQDAANNKEEIA